MAACPSVYMLEYVGYKVGAGIVYFESFLCVLVLCSSSFFLFFLFFIFIFFFLCFMFLVLVLKLEEGNTKY